MFMNIDEIAGRGILKNLSTLDWQQTGCRCATREPRSALFTAFTLALSEGTNDFSAIKSPVDTSVGSGNSTGDRQRRLA
ncbi:unnamed protein product [Caretta caretta]